MIIKVINLMSELLKLCNSPLKFSISEPPNLGLDKVNLFLRINMRRSFILNVYMKEKGRGFKILIFERRGDKDGEKTSNDL